MAEDIMGAGDNWFDWIKAEHREISGIFDAIEATSTDETGKRSVLLAALKKVLARHQLEEENVIYPALRETDRFEEADRLDHDHGHFKTYLFALETMALDDPRWLPDAVDFRDKLAAHFRTEEDTIFPSLQAGLTEEANALLTSRMREEGLMLA